MSHEDYLFAKKLQEQFNQENISANNQRWPTTPSKKTSASSIIDSEWETTDPNPDIHQLFQVFNVKFFWNNLGAVEVKWSPRMYTCAGICTYKGKAGCIVSLSLPLLKFRPRKDLVETLLHEMIHAYLFVTKNNKDRTGHGPEFCKHMDRINKEAGTHITIYHSFHDEVNHYKTHVWRCNGSCKADPPYFGYVRRAVNRAPGPNDFWYPQHLRSCGGSFEKVGEPDNFKAKPRKKVKLNKEPNEGSLKKKNSPPSDVNQKNLKDFFPSKPKSVTKVSSSSTTTTITNKFIHGVQRNKEQGGSIVNHGGVKNNIFGFSSSNSSDAGRSGNESKQVAVSLFTGQGHVLGSRGNNDKSKSRLLGGLASNQNQSQPSSSSTSKSESHNSYFKDLTKVENVVGSTSTDLTLSDSEEEGLSSVSSHCPVCNILIKGVTVNEHLDECIQLENVFNSSLNEIFSDSESDSEDFYTRLPSSPVHQPSSPRILPSSPVHPFNTTSTSPEDLQTKAPASPPVTCPNCITVLTASTINQHLDQCLSFD